MSALSTTAWQEYYVEIANALPAPVLDKLEYRERRLITAAEAFNALRPGDAYEGRLAVRIVLCGAHASECLREADCYRNDYAKRTHCRAQAASMMRAESSAKRTLEREQRLRLAGEAAAGGAGAEPDGARTAEAAAVPQRAAAQAPSFVRAAGSVPPPGQPAPAASPRDRAEAGAAAPSATAEHPAAAPSAAAQHPAVAPSAAAEHPAVAPPAAAEHPAVAAPAAAEHPAVAPSAAAEHPAAAAPPSAPAEHAAVVPPRVAAANPEQSPVPAGAAPPPSPEAIAKAEAFVRAHGLAAAQIRFDRGVTPQNQAYFRQAHFGRVVFPTDPAVIDALIRGTTELLLLLDDAGCETLDAAA